MVYIPITCFNDSKTMVYIDFYLVYDVEKYINTMNNDKNQIR